VTYSPSFESYNELHSGRNLANAQKSQPGSARTRRSSMNAFSESQEMTLNKQLGQIQQSIADSQTRTCKLIFENNNILEGIIKSQKIKKLKEMFIKKIMRTSTAAPPVEFNIFEGKENDSLLRKEGIEVPNTFSNLLNILSVFQIISLLFIYSVSITFFDLLSASSSL
jgi:hypothetical protein